MRIRFRSHLSIFFAILSAPLYAGLSVKTDFEGGSATVDGIDETKREIHLRPGGDPARGWPRWWFVRIDGIGKGESATLVLRGSDRPARNNGADTGKPLSPAWAMPAALIAMVVGSRLTAHRITPGVDRIMIRLHAPESVDLQRTWTARGTR